MPDNVLLLSIPGLRAEDVAHMPMLRQLVEHGDRAPLSASTPAVTLPVHANMTTGLPPSGHGVVANGYYWRERHELEMWTAWNQHIQAPQIWDRLREHDPQLTSAVWFSMSAKGCGADYVCVPAPRHNEDGSESLWCYTKPEGLYEELMADLGHFPLQNFWGPMASIASSAWIADSFIQAAQRYRPNFAFIYLPHLDYAAQKYGPGSAEALAALAELDETIGRLTQGVHKAYTDPPLWLVASEYVITPVNQVVYPNRRLRTPGLLSVLADEQGREQIDFADSLAWAMCDHQIAHVFVRNRDAQQVGRVVDAFRGVPGVAEVLAGEQRARYDVDHERAGDVVLIAEPDSWFAYYYWNDDAAAPGFARSVDIHRKPGYDPVEMFFDPQAMKAGLGPTPLDATLVKGSHGAPVLTEQQRGVLLSSARGVFVEKPMADTDLAELVLRQFGV